MTCVFTRCFRMQVKKSNHRSEQHSARLLNEKSGTFFPLPLPSPCRRHGPSNQDSGRWTQIGRTGLSRSRDQVNNDPILKKVSNGGNSSPKASLPGSRISWSHHGLMGEFLGRFTTSSGHHHLPLSSTPGTIFSVSLKCPEKYGVACA